MKLTSAQIELTANQLAAEPVPDDSKLAPELRNLFGDHTFFLASTGLHIVDPAEPEQADVAIAQVVRLATWDDTHRNRLTPHKPEFTGVLVELNKAA